jgi:hypothetical protein
VSAFGVRRSAVTSHKGSRACGVAWLRSRGTFGEQDALGRGLGWTDIQLLASTLLSGTALWTRDRLLGQTADQFLIPLKA